LLSEKKKKKYLKKSFGPRGQKFSNNTFGFFGPGSNLVGKLKLFPF